MNLRLDDYLRCGEGARGGKSLLGSCSDPTLGSGNAEGLQEFASLIFVDVHAEKLRVPCRVLSDDSSEERVRKRATQHSTRNFPTYPPEPTYCCLLYTSDAADERSSVDL